MSYPQLERYVEKITHLNWLESLSKWDEAVMMPLGGGSARANMLSTLSGMSHDMKTSSQLGDLICAAKKESGLNDWQQANLNHIEYQYKKATCLDQALVENATKATIEAEQAWRQMRAKNNWADFAPILENSFHFFKEICQARASTLNLSLYDAALDEFNAGINTKMIDPIFAELKNTLPDLIRQIQTKQATNNIKAATGPFAIEKQKQLSERLMQMLCFDFDHGRLDVSHHPFCGGIPDDVRLTTRYSESEFISSAMAVCHETGHAKYEQQLPKAYRSQPVGQSHNMAIHESQSLFIEMQICRSSEFMHAIEPVVKTFFGNDDAYNANNLYLLYTKVEPGLIRVDADEVTYPLHVIMRYEIEKGLFDGSIKFNELPAIWNEYMQRFFGLSTLGNDQDGVMQDVHWPCGAFGYFPAYTLGSLFAAQIKQKMAHDITNLNELIAKAELNPIFNWLKTHIHSQAKLRDFNGTINHAVGEPLSAKAYLEHVRHKYLGL